MQHIRTLPLFALAAALAVTIGNPLLNSIVLPTKAETEFNPNVTDIFGYEGMLFLKKEVEVHEVNIGFGFAAGQCFPKWLKHLVQKYTPLLANGNSMDLHQATIDIKDARKDPGLAFETTGFTLLQMGGPSKTKDFRSPSDTQHYYDELRPKLLELFPGASRIEFFEKSTIIRGGDHLRDQPASVNETHMDYSQNETARHEFNLEYPVNPKHRAPRALFGELDTSEEEFRVMLGVWKPVYMKNPVCDHPLAVMDARTIDINDERPVPTHINLGGVFQYNQLLGKIVHNPQQRWHYYSFQEETEVLVFTHYTKGKQFANPHGSFVNPNCPEGYQSRVSVELRAAVFFPKETKANSVSSTDK